MFKMSYLKLSLSFDVIVKHPIRPPQSLAEREITNYKLENYKLQIKNKKLQTNKPSPELLIGVEAKCIRWQCQRAARFPLLLFRCKHYLLLLRWNDFLAGTLITNKVYENIIHLKCLWGLWRWRGLLEELLINPMQNFGIIFEKSNAQF